MPQRKKQNDLLIIFTRYPKAGETKTRLIPVLGPEKAADLQRAMSEFIFSQCRTLQKKKDIRIDVYYVGSQQDKVRSWVPKEMGCFPQRGKSLGDRMSNAFLCNFNSNINKIIVVGSDCPHITPEILIQGYDLLEEKDLVLGPTYDGGYYLIGLKNYAPFLLDEIDWGKEQVLGQTIDKARRHGLTWGMLSKLADIDRVEDLPYLKKIDGHFSEFLNSDE